MINIVDHFPIYTIFFLLQETLDDINLFSIMTVMSFLLSIPLMLYVDGIKFSPAYLQSTVSIVS